MKEIVIKKCERHGETEHAFYNGKLRCKKCLVEYDYQKRHRIKEQLVEYKGGKCEICGYNKCLNALDFHHRNPEEKEYALNTANYNKSFEKLKKEVDKCILVCANCHREIHEEERDKEFLKTKTQFFPIKKIDKIDKDLVFKLINEGKTQPEIAKIINVSVGTLKRFVSQNNIDMRKKNFNKDKKPLPSYEEIKSHVESGLTFTKIGEIYNISRKTVSKIYKQNSQVAQ